MAVSLIVIVYLLCAIAANNIVAIFGQQALVYTAAILIPFDLTARDYLHTKWQNDGLMLKVKMTALIIGGSLLSYVTNPDIKLVAIASATSFLLAGAIDYLVYQILIKKPLYVKMNMSNIASSIVDSLIFPFIAFGAIVWSLSIAQAAIKILGGFVWAALLSYLIMKVKTNGKNRSTD